MTNEIRLYSPSSGRCLHGSPQESERQLILEDFHAGVRVIADKDRGEVRGFVPIRQGTANPCFAVVPVREDAHPLMSFYTTVKRAIDKKESANIRTKTAEGKLFQDPAVRPVISDDVSVSDGPSGHYCVPSVTAGVALLWDTVSPFDQTGVVGHSDLSGTYDVVYRVSSEGDTDNDETIFSRLFSDFL